MTQQPKTFNPNDHVIKLKSKGGAKDYLPVQWRIAWFRQECPQGTIDTEELEVDLDREMEEEVEVWNKQKNQYDKVVKRAKGYARYKAIVTDGKGGRATGTKSEKAASFSDFIEKSETGAIGRALAALGYGTQFAPEFDEQHRIVDAPADRGNPQPEEQRTSTASTAPSTAQQQTMESEMLITEQQLNSIRKLHEYLGKTEPEGLASISNLEAKKLIQSLAAQYRQSKSPTRA